MTVIVEERSPMSSAGVVQCQCGRTVSVLVSNTTYPCPCGRTYRRETRTVGTSPVLVVRM